MNQHLTTQTPIGSAPSFVESGSPASPPPANQVNPLVRLHGLLAGRYHWAIVLGLILGIGAAMLAYTRVTSTYQSTGLIQIKPVVTPILYANEQNSVMPMFDAFIETQIATLRDQRTIMLAMDSAEWKAAVAKSEPYPIAKFIANLDASHQKGTELIQVAFTDQDPDLAKVGVKVIEDAYKKHADENDNDVDSKNMQRLEDRRSSLTLTLKGFNDNILAIANEYGTDDLQQILQPKLEQVNRLQSNIQEAQIMLASVQGDVSAATQPSIDTPPEHLTPEIVAARGDSIMQRLIQDHSQAEENVSRLRASVGDSHPMLAGALASQHAIEAEIDSRMHIYDSPNTQSDVLPSAGSRNAPGDQVKPLQRRVAELQKLSDAANKELVAIGQQELHIRSLKQDIERTQQDLDAVRARIDHTIMEAPAVSGRITIMNEGDVPQKPVRNRRLPSTVASALAGLLLGIGAVAAIGALDRRVKSVSQAESAFDRSRRILGVLPALPEDLADADQAATAAFCVHHIRTLLQIGVGRAAHPIIAVTSAAPGDGKTSFVLSLGLSYAATGTRTLLIDFDVVGAGLTFRVDAIVRRKIGEVLIREGLLTREALAHALTRVEKSGKRLGETLVALGLIEQPDLDTALSAQMESSLGLLDVLDGEPLANCVLHSGTPDLSILPVGNVGARHVGQLSIGEVHRILAEARGTFDVVLIDTGPILGSLEACIVAAAADEVILIVSSGQERSLIQKAFEFLGNVNAKISGIVFNRAKLEEIEHSAGYSSYHTSRRLRSPVVNSAVPENGRLSRFGPVAQAVAMSEAAASNGSSTAGEN